MINIPKRQTDRRPYVVTITCLEVGRWWWVESRLAGWLGRGQGSKMSPDIDLLERRRPSKKEIGPAQNWTAVIGSLAPDRPIPIIAPYPTSIVLYPHPPHLLLHTSVLLFRSKASSPICTQILMIHPKYPSTYLNTESRRTSSAIHHRRLLHQYLRSNHGTINSGPFCIPLIRSASFLPSPA